MIRPGHDTDAPAIIALIARCWSDYPGLSLHMDEEPDLHALASHFAGQAGALWLADAPAGQGPPNSLQGMIATRPLATPGLWEICRLYVHPDHHGAGLAPHLLTLAESHAAARTPHPRFELWTDTRFHRAHRFYEKHGYRRTGHRALNDRSDSHEHRYEKTPLAPGAPPLPHCLPPPPDPIVPLT